MVSLGSNVGDRLSQLQVALDRLGGHPGIAVRAVSPVYETEPVGGPPQAPYLNAVALLDVDLAPPELLAELHRIEELGGRVRDERWGPRTLDLDLVVQPPYAGTRDGLTLPHPRAHERAFVLAPWVDLDPVAELPGRGRIAALLAAAQAGAGQGGAGCGEPARGGVQQDDVQQDGEGQGGAQPDGAPSGAVRRRADLVLWLPR